VSQWDHIHSCPTACFSAIPGLHDSLAYNLPALKFEHRRTKHLGPIGVRAALREGEAVAYGNTIFDLVRHVASADILKIGRDSALAFQIARLAGRIVTINNQNDGIVGMKAGKRQGLAPLDRTLEPGDGYGTSLGLGLGFGLGPGFSHIAPPNARGARRCVPELYYDTPRLEVEPPV